MKNLSAGELQTLLHALRLDKMRESAEGKDLAEFWGTCERGDWMLRLLGRMCDDEGWPTRLEVCTFLCDVAQSVLPLISSWDKEPARCLDTARGWGAGTAATENVRAAQVLIDRSIAFQFYGSCVSDRVTLDIRAVYAMCAVAFAVTFAAGLMERPSTLYLSTLANGAAGAVARAQAGTQTHRETFRELADLCRLAVQVECTAEAAR